MVRRRGVGSEALEPVLEMWDWQIQKGVLW